MTVNEPEAAMEPPQAVEPVVVAATTDRPSRPMTSCWAVVALAQELTEARGHFYQTRRTVDPFGATSRVAYDAYDLLPTSASDAR